jgi:hypothetical protein
MRKTIAPTSDGAGFNYFVDDRFVCTVWHSDKGEWTVATPDGPYWRERTRVDAEDRANAICSRS